VCPSNTCMLFPFSTFHIIILLSFEPEKSVFPFVVIAIQWIIFSCCSNVLISFQLLTFHYIILPSNEEENIYSLSYENMTYETVSEWAISVVISVPLCESQTSIILSSELLTTKLQFGEKQTHYARHVLHSKLWIRKSASTSHIFIVLSCEQVKTSLLSLE